MERRAAVVGLALSVVGGLLMVWAQPPPQLTPTVPMDHVANLVLGLLAVLGRLGLSVGAVMLALAVLIKVTGRPPVKGHPNVLLLAGLGLTLVATLVEVSLFSYLANVDRMRFMLAASSGAALVHVVGTALVSLWLTGLLTSQSFISRQPIRAQRSPDA